MIVNPQLFNYRIIISALFVVLVVLGVFCFTHYKATKSSAAFLQQEKMLIEKELTDVLTSYDELNENYNLIASDLRAAKQEAQSVLDALKLHSNDSSLIRQFQRQLTALQTRNKALISTIDSLNSTKTKPKERRPIMKPTAQKTH